MKIPVSLTGLLLAVTGTALAGTHDQTQSGSTWSGYVSKGGPFTAVSATWTQPTVTCPVPNARASFWIGFDGLGNGTVEQVGTLATCGSGGTVVYRGWWEMVAGTGDRGGENIPVAPGDKITASVRFVSGNYRLEVRDLTNGQHFEETKSCTVTCARSMAEWIVERPGSGTYPLADFGKVEFDRAEAAATGPNQDLKHLPGLIRLDMVHAGTTLSSPSSIHGTSSYHCTWHAAE